MGVWLRFVVHHIEASRLDLCDELLSREGVHEVALEQVADLDRLAAQHAPDDVGGRSERAQVERRPLTRPERQQEGAAWGQRGASVAQERDAAPAPRRQHV